MSWRATTSRYAVWLALVAMLFCAISSAVLLDLGRRGPRGTR